MPPFHIAQIEGKGAGVIADRAILTGTRLIAEQPILVIPRFGMLKRTDLQTIKTTIETLSNKKRKELFRLANSFTDLPQIEGIIRTNAIPLGTQATEGGLFLRCSRFNHSCCANAAYSWQEDRAEEVVHAIKDIEPGEEITVRYLTDEQWLLPRDERRMRMDGVFKFFCQCNICGASEDVVQASDSRRAQIKRMDDAVGAGVLIVLDPSRALAFCRDTLRLLDEEGASFPEKRSVFYDAFQICVAHGDWARARPFALLEMKAVEGFQGLDSSAYRDTQALAGSPWTHRLAGTSKKWSMAASRALDAAADGFDSWLWRRAA